MKKTEYPYIKLEVPIWINRDYELLIMLPMSYENCTFTSKLQFIDKSIASFTVTKTTNIINPMVLVQLHLSELETGGLEADTIAKFDVKIECNGDTGTLFAGEIPISKTIT